MVLSKFYVWTQVKKKLIELLGMMNVGRKRHKNK